MQTPYVLLAITLIGMPAALTLLVLEYIPQWRWRSGWREGLTLIFGIQCALGAAAGIVLLAGMLAPVAG